MTPQERIDGNRTAQAILGLAKGATETHRALLMGAFPLAIEFAILRLIGATGVSWAFIISLVPATIALHIATLGVLFVIGVTGIFIEIAASYAFRTTER